MKTLFVIFLLAFCLTGLSLGVNTTTWAYESIHALQTIATEYPVLTSLPNPWYTNYTQAGEWGAHCSWAGITCGLNYTVNTLTFDSTVDSFQLEGNFSQAFFDLPHLFSLTLRGQDFYGTVPSKIVVNSFALTNLIVSNCNLHGPFPVITYNISGNALTRIDFSHNHFNESFPNDLFNATKFRSLTSLDLSHNELSGQLGLDACGTQFQNLFVNDNQLSGTVDCLGARASVDLSNNMFSGALPVFASNETRLDNNRFSDFGSVFSTSRSTSYDLILTFSNNPINKDLPASIASGQRFILLDMSSCGITGSFSNSWESANIQDLVARNNSITSLWTPTSAQLASLSYIDLSYNPITAFSGFGADAVALKSLLCHNCKIAGTIPASIASIPGLQSLDLGGNLLTGALPTFASVDYLLSLDLSDNELTGKPLTLLQSMGTSHQLLYIDVARNGFELCDSSTYGPTLNIQFGAYCSAICQSTQETIDSACLSAWTHCTLADCTPDGTLPPDGGASFPVAPPPGIPTTPPSLPPTSAPQSSSPSSPPTVQSPEAIAPTLVEPTSMPTGQAGPQEAPSNDASFAGVHLLHALFITILVLSSVVLL